MNDTNLGIHSVYDTPEDKHIHWLEVQLRNVKNLLRDEWNLRHRIASPWDCTNGDCPYLGKPMSKDCQCFKDACERHATRVAEVK